MALLQLSLLGGFDCRSRAGEAIVFPTRKVRALFAYLAASAGQRHERDKLAALLWDDHPDAQALGNLRKTLSRLRQALPEEAGGCVVAETTCLGLRADGVALDVALFDRLAADGTPGTLERAASLYRGAFLEGFDHCGEAFEDWLQGERRRLDETLRQVLQRLLDHYVVTGGIDRAIQVALRLLALDPLQEGVHRALMRLYMYQDRVGSALDQYRSCRDVLRREVGVAPAPETERLKAELLQLLPPGGDRGAGAPLREQDDLPERVAIVGTAAEARAPARGAATGRPSVAVLSFAGPEDEAANRTLGDGMAEDIATELGRFRELDVIAPVSALAFRNAAVPPERIGVELGAASVVDGRVRRMGGEVRVTVRLVESETGRQLWAERYDCARAGLFDVQDELVRRIVAALVGQIEDARLAATRRKPPQDWEAYDFWLRGSSALRRADLAAIGEARDCFQQAIARDPGFARAYVGLATAHLNEWACFSWNHWFFLQQEAVELAQTAVRLDGRDHRAHCILGLARLYGREYEAARGQLRKALELNPNDADVLAHASVAMSWLGEHGPAVDMGRRALHLAPHHPEWYAAFVGIVLFAARLYEEAIAVMAAAPEGLCNTPAILAACYAHLGEIDRCSGYRETVYRHHRRQLARGLFPEGMGCLDWLLALDPFREASDLEHYAEGLRKAGFL